MYGGPTLSVWWEVWFYKPGRLLLSPLQHIRPSLLRPASVDALGIMGALRMPQWRVDLAEIGFLGVGLGNHCELNWMLLTNWVVDV